VCTGTGEITLRCTRRGAHVTGIGLTETMLASAVCKSRALVHFVGARHHDGTFDVAILSFALQNMPFAARVETLREAVRVRREPWRTILSTRRRSSDVTDPHEQ
jgi:ubiquinone/menaquinone biosynthesis C-methylase UbiE